MQKRGAGVADFREEERQILGSVLPNVAAALRTPLNNLHMAAERIARQLPDDGLEGAVLQQSYHRLLRLVSNLSMGPELLSEQPFQLQNLELVAWLGDLCQQAASAADALGIGLSFTCRERYLVAAVHREYLERLVWNLLSNALKFTPPDGSITVTLAEKAGQLLLSVQDTGCGISSEHLETLFHRSSQRDRMEPPDLPPRGRGARRTAAAGESGGCGHTGARVAAPRAAGRTGAGSAHRLCRRLLPCDDGAERRLALSGVLPALSGLNIYHIDFT